MNCELTNKNETKDIVKLDSRLSTERLILLPLNPHQLALAVDNYSKMQSDLGLRIVKTSLDEELEYAMKIRLQKVLLDVDNYLWLTNRAIINKQENQIVGFIMIKGCPNKDGEVIVGYGIDENYRRKGYATEALQGLTQWIFKNTKALFVIADTEKTNIASHKVLQKAGAQMYKETDELVWWRIQRQK